MKISPARKTFLGFTLFLLVWKLAILCSLPIELAGNVEWLEKGNLTKALMNGLIVPVGDYPFFPREGGYYLVSVLALPFFYLFGPTAFSLHLVGILFAIGTFAGWYYILNRYFGLNVAVIFSLLYIFAPPLFSRISVLTTTTHNEIGLFLVLMLILAMRILEKRPIKNQTSGFVLLGITAGLGIWFCYTAAVMWLVCLMTFILLERSVFKSRNFWIAIGLSLLGCVQLLIDITKSESILYQLFFNPDWRALMDRNVGTVLYDYVINSMGFTGDLSGLVYYFTICLAFAAAGLILLSPRRSVERWPVLNKMMAAKNSIVFIRILCSFIVLYMGFFIFSIYDVTRLIALPPESVYRYFVPLYPLVMVLIALLISALILNKSKIVKTLALILLLFNVGSGLYANASYMTLQNGSRLMNTEGYSTVYLGINLYYRYMDRTNEFTQIVNDLEGVERKELLYGFAFGRGSDCYEESPFCDLTENLVTVKDFLAQPVPYEDRLLMSDAVIDGIIETNYLPIGLCFGTLKHRSSLNVLNRDPEYFYNGINAYPRDYRHRFHMGVGYLASRLTFEEIEKLTAKILPEYRQSFYSGLGIGMERHLPESQQALRQLYLSNNLDGKRAVMFGQSIYQKQMTYIFQGMFARERKSCVTCDIVRFELD